MPFIGYSQIAPLTAN